MSCAVPVASLVQPGGHRPSLSRFSSRSDMFCAAALPCTSAARLRQMWKGGAVRRKDGTLLHRENKTTGKRRQRTFLPALLAGRQGSGCLQAPEGRHAVVVPPAQTCRPSLQLQQTRARSCSATFLFLMLVI